MNMITVAQVKSYCGITASTYDADIAIYIPVAEAAIKSITRNRYTMRVSGTTTAGSTTIPIYSLYGWGWSRGHEGDCKLWDTQFRIDDVTEYVENGASVTGTGVPAGAYVTDVYDIDSSGAWSPNIELSSAATASGSVTLTLGLPISLMPVVAKGVFWLVGNKTTSAINAGWSSRSMGPLSVTLGGNQAIDNKYGMPVWFVSAFPRYHGGH